MGILLEGEEYANKKRKSSRPDQHPDARLQMTMRWRVMTAMAVLVATAAAGAAQTGSSLAERLQRKLESIVRFGAIPRLETQTTVIDEGEINAYLRHYLQGDIPPGISTPTVRILGDERLSASATLDIATLTAGRPPSDGLDPLRLLSGAVPAVITGRLVTGEGSGHFVLETAQLAGVPLPRALVSQLVTRYSVTPASPDGVDIDAPFDLPASIREIRVDPGQVTVLQ